MAAAVVRRAPYKDFLQPALQRRFSLTALVLLGVAYAQAILLVCSWDQSFLWLWFPLGPAGIRTALIFTSGLGILILRIAHYHVGVRTAESTWQGLRTSLFTAKALETMFWYCFSSILFGYVYLSAIPESANLRWIIYFSGDRARLNERTLFLMSHMFVSGIVQTCVHYYKDSDRLVLQPTRDKEGQLQSQSADLPTNAWTIVTTVLKQFSGIVLQSAYALLFSLGIYYGLLRSLVWGWTLMFMRPFYNLPKASMVPPSWPSDLWVMGRCIWASTLLLLLWTIGNVAFSVFMVQDPLKNAKPLSTDSKDPNGTLLNGLKSKKPSVQSFAMWELAHIAENFEAHRRLIYDDIDRKDGPMWAQTYAICMELVKSIETRVEQYGQPVHPPAPVQAPQPAPEATRDRVTAPIKGESIFTPKVPSKTISGYALEKVEQVAQGHNPTPMSQLSPLAKKAWRNARDSMLSKEQQESLSSSGVAGQLHSLAVRMVGIEWLGSLVRQEFRDRFAAAVLGMPYADPALYSNAVHALCHLAVHSLSEDKYGNVHKDVPTIVRTLTRVINSIEALKQRFPTHWTDTTGSKACPEVELVVDALKKGLSQVVFNFEPFRNDLRLTLSDIRLAREVSAPLKPVEQVAKETEVETTNKGPESRRGQEPAPRRRASEKRIEPRKVVEMEEVPAAARRRPSNLSR